MEENWLALYLSIMTNRNAKLSLIAMGISFPTQKRRNNLSDDDYEKIIELKKTHTWEDISKIVGIEGGSLSSLVSIYKRKKRKAMDICQITDYQEQLYN